MSGILGNGKDYDYGYGSMKMRDYRIAFFTVDWNYELVESTLHGLKRYVDEHENVSLCIFDCFGKDQDNARDRSEYAIFELPDLSQFDGLLIQGNQIVLNRAREGVARKVVQSGIPAVTIDCPIEGATLVTVDNRAAQRDLTEHLIKDHNARRLVYLTGNLTNGCPEAQQRLDGFRDACAAGGIPPKNIDITSCTWRTTDGIRVVRQWLNQKRPLPDAFVCGNDEMAFGVIEALQEAGYNVPGDVRVTGFDNVTSAELSNPRLSTVHRDYAMLNYFAMDTLINKIDGRETREMVPFEYDLVCSESCGCSEAAMPDYIRDKYFKQTRFLKSFYIQQDQMAEELFEASDLLELMDIVEKNRAVFGCDNVYLCINDYYYDNYEKKQWCHDSEVFGEEMILAACDHTGFTADENHLYARFPTRDLLPDSLRREERFLMFYPLHYNTYSIGYLVMDSISEAAKLNLHESIFSFLEIAIENVRKKGLLRHFNSVLDNLYVHDSLTGLYNRFGFERFGQLTYDRFMASDGGAQILFVDMDDMKGINDRFGHEIGDAAICAAAQALRTACGSQDFLMRYGGDEFLVIASCRETGLKAAIQRAIRESNHASEMPFTLSMSVGIVHAEALDGRSLDECIQAADSQMYNNKKRRKTGGL